MNVDIESVRNMRGNDDLNASVNKVFVVNDIPLIGVWTQTYIDEKQKKKLKKIELRHHKPKLECYFMFHIYIYIYKLQSH